MKRNKKRSVRIYVVGVIFVLIAVALWVRLFQVQVFARSHYSDVATSQWRVTKEVPAVRGGIFDRHGRPLALSIRSCSVSIQPGDVENRDKVVAVLAKYLAVSKSSIRKKIRSKKSFIWVERQCSLSEKARAEIKALPGVGLHWEADRVYPYGGVAAKVIGFVGHDSKGGAGIEAAFDNELGGVPGWEVVQRDGRYRAIGYGTYAEKKPENGKHIILTLDVSLQEIAEVELKKAVRSTRANGGAVIFMECATGDILALAEWPSALSRESKFFVDSLWTIRSLSHVYEPGSTFKLVTVAALLETEKVKSFDVFDAENGHALIGRARISDSHPHGHLTFREGFVYSSNIVMAKASLALKPKEFFSFVRLFGFGAKTGIRLLGESPGRVAPVEEWSERTQITMAFGQEIAVTPLQMVNAFAAVANDGELMTPRIVKAVCDDGRGKIRKSKPTPIRRVVGRDTARRIRAFCRSVVEEGTGTRANVPFVELSGKTGTGEKASPRGGYLQNKYVASFIGFAPSDDPQIVCLVMLDEPDHKNRFGGVSAAPVFARIIEAVANSTSALDEVLSTAVVADSEVGSGRFKAPNFLRLDRAGAMERARELELNVLCKGDAGEVVAQDPDPGVAMERDEIIRLYLSGKSGRGKKAPNLVGLPLRLAKREAVESGFTCQVVGSGVVARQRPAPGKRAQKGVIRVFCTTGAPSKG